MKGFLYFGRLEKEKGFDAILGMLRMFLHNGELPFSLFIFGAGSYENELLELANESKNIHFFGWKKLPEIQRYVENCEYCLMPSTFLETFGLTALTAISRGLPVIGYKKGGLVPFIEEDHNLENYEGICTDEKLFNCVSELLTAKKKTTKPTISLEKYSKENWITTIYPLLGKHKKILLVSDFINKVGGIETYIHDVKELLESHGYEVKIRGRELPKGWKGTVKKLFGIGWGAFNFIDAFRLWRFCKKWQPDIIWYNSTLRRLGRMSVWVGGFFAKERWMMYHDFGYFFPFPKKLLYEQQIKTPLTFFSFLSMAKQRAITTSIFVVGKFISLNLLKRKLSTIDKHLVPSPFLVDILHKSHQISKNKIFCLEHFLQK
ncbi:group 1 glycosyl transferase [candidate division SR1 bacterium RAAC1_SR1_1]|nr:group 1 glycosyl transferase [candidate division SR1 bacterium RAAC1_SR1_1]